MRFLRVLSAAVVAVCASTFLPATAHGQVFLGLGGGGTFPISNLDHTYNTGYNILATLGTHIPTTPFGFRVDGMFNELPDKPDLFDGTSFNVQIWTANANIVASIVPGGPVVPYLIAGAGYYNSSFRVSTSGGEVFTGGSTHINDFGLNGGGGLRVGFGGIGLFAEARYHYIFSNHASNPSHAYEMIPVTVGVRFGG
jgi:hypothetical protein